MHRILPAVRVGGRRIVSRPAPRIPPFVIPTNADSFYLRAGTSLLHTTPPRFNEAPRSPFEVFREVLREEIKKNREFEQNVQQLKGDVTKMQDSEALKQARTAYERARLMTSIKENPRLRAAAEQLRKSGVQIGDAVSETLRTMEESEVMRAISRATSAASSAIATSTEPIRKTAAYKALADTLVDALDDSGSTKHGGYEEKEQRRLRRQRRLAKAGLQGTSRMRVPANAEAGEALVLHKDNEKNERWERLKESNPVLRQFGELRKQYDESENPVISSMRSVTSTIGSWFDETETAAVTRRLREMDPDFAIEPFHRELREYIIPEMVDALISADRESLRQWCGEAAYNVIWAGLEVYLTQGLKPECQVLDIKNVDISSGKITEENLPVFVVSFSTQELSMWRNRKTKEVVVGATDNVEKCMYAAVITRVEEELDSEITAGWKFVQLMRRSTPAFL